MSTSFLDEMRRGALARARGLRAAPPGGGDHPHRPRGGFARALKEAKATAGPRIIAEFKRRSPSRGALAADAEVAPRVRSYAARGATAISILTEPSRFGGGLEDLSAARRVTDRPLLMKDFVVDVAQIEAGFAFGADAVLLIAALLDDHRLDELLAAIAERGGEALVEVRNEHELDRILAGSFARRPAIIGVNNRDLETLAVDRRRAPELLTRVPDSIVRVAESGYASAADLAEVRDVAHAVLVGTALMRTRPSETLLPEGETCG